MTTPRLLALLWAFLFGSAHAGSSPIESLRLVEAKTVTGTTYADYLDAVGRAQYAVKSGPADPKAEAILILYQEAGLVWQLRVGGQRDVLERAKWVQGFVQRYPKLALPLDKGGASTYSPSMQQNAIDLEQIMRFIWLDASEKLSRLPRQ